MGAINGQGRKRKILVCLLALFLVGGLALMIKEALNMKKYSPTTDREKLAAELRALDPNEYGGFYSSNDGNTLNVNVLPDKPLLLGKNLSDVEFHTVRYSLKQLQDLREIFQGRMQELSINLLSIINRKNKLEIHVLREIDPRIAQEIALHGGTEDMYEIIIDDEPFRYSTEQEELSAEDTAKEEVHENEVKAGVKVKDGGCSIRYRGTQKFRSSLTCGILYDDGDAGYASCGHGKMVGDVAYYYPPKSSPPYYSSTWPPMSDLAKLGPVVQVAVGGDVDYGIIDVQNLDNSPAGESLNGIKANYQGGWPYQGDTVRLCGMFSQNSGLVIDDDATVPIEGTTHTHMLLCTNTSQEGDSGAPLYWIFSPGNWSLSGILSGSNSTMTAFSRFDYDSADGGFSMAKW